MRLRLPFRSLLILLAAVHQPLHAQGPRQADLALTGIGLHSIQSGTSAGFWAQGGGVECGFSRWHGLGFAAAVTGIHAGSIAQTGVPLSQVDALVGPRYRHRAGQRASFFGEGLFGLAHGFGSVFPNASGQSPTANSAALHLGGGLDVRLSRRLAWRAFEASWVRSELPNGANDRQNSASLATGLALQWPRPTTQTGIAPRRPRAL